MYSFEGRTVFITGGARGQGRSHAVAFARAGADVVVCDLCGPLGTGYPSATPEDLAETQRLVEAQDRRCLARVADVRVPEQLAAVVAEAAAELGKVDILVANAGILDGASIQRMSVERWQNTIDTNLNGVFHAVRAVLPGMLEQRYGRIIAISSMAGRRAYGHGSNYAASKWGIIGMIKDIALDVAREGITANVVCPATTNTLMAVNDSAFRAFSPDLEAPTVEDFKKVSSRFHPQGVAWVEPEDISAMVLFLASEQARHVTGDVMTVSAGMMAQNSG